MAVQYIKSGEGEDEEITACLVLRRSHVIYNCIFLPSYSETTYSLTALCRTYGTFYVDGNQLSENSTASTDYFTSAQETFATLPRLLAIACTRRGDSDGYVLASISSSFVSNETWKCMPNGSVSDANWMHLGYDDYTWPSAVNVGPNNWIAVAPDALGVWYANDNTKGDQTAFCRGTAGQSMSLLFRWVPAPFFFFFFFFFSCRRR